MSDIDIISDIQPIGARPITNRVDSHTDIGGRVYEAGEHNVLGKALWVHVGDEDPVPVAMMLTAIGPQSEALYGAGVYLSIAPDGRAAAKGAELPVPGGSVTLFMDEAAKLFVYSQLEQNITIIRNRRQMEANARAAAWPAKLRPIVKWWLTRNARG